MALEQRSYLSNQNKNARAWFSGSVLDNDEQLNCSISNTRLIQLQLLPHFPLINMRQAFPSVISHFGADPDAGSDALAQYAAAIKSNRRSRKTLTTKQTNSTTTCSRP
jgi:hypothetical protein